VSHLHNRDAATARKLKAAMLAPADVGDEPPRYSVGTPDARPASMAGAELRRFYIDNGLLRAGTAETDPFRRLYGSQRDRVPILRLDAAGRRAAAHHIANPLPEHVAHRAFGSW